MLLGKYLKPLGNFCSSFLVVTGLICANVLLHTPEKEFWKKYSLLIVGSSIGFCCYLVVFLKKASYFNLRSKAFATYWPLASMGEENYVKLLRFGKQAKLFVILTFLSSFTTSTVGLPWYGDEYDLILPFKVYSDSLGKWAYPVLVIFYLSIYHCGFSIISTTFILIHFCLHLRMQFFLLTKRLQHLIKPSKFLEDQEPLFDENYQTHVREELKACIQYHQNLLWVSKKINDLVLLPIFLFTTTSILFAVAVIFFLKDFQYAIIRGLPLALTGGLVTSGFCICGQQLQDESLELFNVSILLPWYLWNVKNIKMYQILLIKSQSPIILSGSGIININYTLFNSLYRTITTVLSFFMNV